MDRGQNQGRVRHLTGLVWGGLGLIVAILLVIYVKSPQPPARLPVLGEMTEFVLTNQDGQTVSLDKLKGQVWVADAIFTRCPGECLLMSTHMKSIQDILPASAPIQLVSLTTDPDFDAPAILKKYGEHFGADANRWSFLTGSKAALHDAEINGLKLAVVPKTPEQQESPNDLFIHSEKFVLVDRQGRLRGWFDGEKPEAPAQVAAAAQQLARE